MNLIDDIDPVRALGRRILNLFANLTNILNPIVGCCINLYHVHGTSRRDGFAGRAFIAGASICRVLAVNRLGKDLRNGGLTGSTGSAEQIGMSDTAGIDLICQRCHNVILPFADDFPKDTELYKLLTTKPSEVAHETVDDEKEDQNG